MTSFRPFTPWLSRTSPFWFSVYTALAAFLVYSAVYGFRKAFSSAAFDDQAFGGVNYKIWMVSAQVLGYACSKFIGIRLMAELRRGSRAIGVLLLVGLAGISWFFFALIPAPYNLIFLFVNGMSLGLIWGLIFSYLEGRTTTDVLGAVLSISFIVSAGFARSTGSFLMLDWNVPERWMPFAACAAFTIPLLLFLWLLDQVPPPGPADEALRTPRVPMNAASRKRFLQEFGPGLLMLIIAYVMLTSLRDFRDNFSKEIWTTLGHGDSPAIFTIAELPVAMVVLLVVGSLVVVRNNMLALQLNHVIVILGLAIVGIATLLQQQSLIGPISWMTLTGTGLYLGYIPFNCILFERLIAAFKYSGTVGFVMYLSDAFGYAGSVVVGLVKQFAQGAGHWVHFFAQASYVVSICGMILMGISWMYFERKARPRVPNTHIAAIGTAGPN